MASAPTSAFTAVPDLQTLAQQADELSNELIILQQSCGHESTSTDIHDAATELKFIACELDSLNNTVKANKALYTDAFDQDLCEIRAHLGAIFEDVSDCCREMQKADNPQSSTVGWLTKKRYVRKLQKHLEANKTTLIVMRTVLHHGKEYGKHHSPERLAESSPHVLQEDLAILETVFANRGAIKKLRKLSKTSHQHTLSSSSVGTADTSPSFKPGSHGRNLSSATGIDVPFTADVLPDGLEDKKHKNKDVLARRFSRRGVRLAVHSSIMDTNAHEVPISLRKKWIHQARSRRRSSELDVAHPSFAALSKISEVNSSVCGEDTAAALSLRKAPVTPEAVGEIDSTSSPSPSPPRSPLKLNWMANGPDAALTNSPPGSSRLRRLMAKLSRTSLGDKRNSPERVTDPVKQTGRAGPENEVPGKT